jgi:hypothetical protein
MQSEVKNSGLTCEMISRKLKVIILIPMLEGEIREGSCIREFQVCKVPIQYLTIIWREIDLTEKFSSNRNKKIFINSSLEIPSNINSQ